jgi:hypothetical protein
MVDETLYQFSIIRAAFGAGRRLKSDLSGFTAPETAQSMAARPGLISTPT